MRFQYRWLRGLLSAMLLAFLAAAAFPQGKIGKVDDFWGSLYTSRTAASVLARRGGPRGENSLARLRHWNEIAVNASGLDHTPVAIGETRVFGEQLGPGRAARAMAIVHIAIFDAVNAVEGKFESFSGIPRENGNTSVDAAIAQAASDTLAALFPSQAGSFHSLLASDLAQIPNGAAKTKGIDLGRRSADAILEQRFADGSVHPEPIYGAGYTPKMDAGYWRKDPISLIPVALGAHWGEVQPFVLQSVSQFRVPAPPAMDTPEYAAAYDEVKRLGGDGIATSTERTQDQTEIGLFWAYDGTPSLCAPPRLYNQIVIAIAEQKNSDTMDTARLLALVNTAMADAGTSSWESKYHYEMWRPITGIREADEGTGPNGMGDGNPDTAGDAAFTPLGAPATNLTGPNFTPPFPAYPSGHAVFGGAVFETLRNFYHTDHIRFTFVSDELNGETVDNEGNTRPLRPRTFRTLSQAEEENGQSRIYLGIHWSFDKTEGIAQGRRIADYVFENAFTRKRGNR